MPKSFNWKNLDIDAVKPRGLSGSLLFTSFLWAFFLSGVWAGYDRARWWSRFEWRW